MEVGISLVLLSGVVVISEQLICFHLMLEFSLVSVNPIYPSKKFLCFLFTLFYLSLDCLADFFLKIQINLVMISKHCKITIRVIQHIYSFPDF